MQIDWPGACSTREMAGKVRAAIAAAWLAACGGGVEDQAESIAGIGASLLWVGDTHLRYDGYWIPSDLVMSDRALEVYTQTYPMGAAAEVRLFWSDRPQTRIRSSLMSFDVDRAGPFANNAQWRASIPSSDLGADLPVEYWIRAEDRAGRVLWDSRDGANYSIVPRREIPLFDGGSTGCWQTSGPGSFSSNDGILSAHPRDGLGLYWCAYPTPRNFELSLEWSLTGATDNSGVMVRFPDPRNFGYENPAWVPIHYGFEIQIDEIARPDGADFHRTGSIYGEPSQQYTRQTAHPPGEWSRFDIRVQEQTYSVMLDGRQTTRFDFTGDPAQPERALPTAPGAPRFIGLQAHSGTVRFRAVRLRSL